jgi:1,2-diacylglycerol 3-beta-galactosyltransferase
VTGARRRALIVYSRVGGGHLSAARALADAFEATGRVRTHLTDVYLDCGRFPVTRFPWAYAQLARHHPRLWALLFHSSNHRLDATPILAPFLEHGLQTCIKAQKPDVVVSVLPMVNGLVAKVAPRSEVVLTDWYGVHRTWVGRGVNHYTAPTDSAKQDMIRYGAPPDAVDVIGIPVRTAFATSDAPRQQHDRFTILAMVGAEGSPRTLRNIEHLLQLRIDADAIVVCGRNEALRRRVHALPARVTVRALGFVDNIPELMRAADVLVTKAGGLTLAEAFCCGVPVVVSDVLPGQETGNLEYALGAGAVAYAPTPAHLQRLISDLYTDRQQREQLAARARTVARPDAAAQVVANVLQRLDSDG